MFVLFLRAVIESSMKVIRNADHEKILMKCAAFKLQKKN